MQRRFAISAAIAVLVGSVAIAGFLLAPWSRATAAGTKIVYVPIDPKVFVGHATVTGWVKTHNEAAINAHAAQLWAGLTTLTSQKVAGMPLAVFMTWYTPCDVYPPTVSPKCNHAIVHNPLDLEIPEQAFRLPRVILSTNIFSGVKYNKEMVDFIDAGYEGASYANASGLIKAMKAGETDLPDTAAPSSMMTKPVYQLISSTQPTTIGYWQGPGLNVPLSASTSPLVPDVSTWLQVAVIDPTGKATNAKPLTFCANTIDPTGAVVAHRNYVAPARSYPVISISEMYWFTLSGADVEHVAQLRDDYVAVQTARLLRTYGPRALKQDRGCPAAKIANPAYAFVGMHVVTAELNNVWTWQTFWWQPQPKVRPLPGSQGPFRHFALATAYWTINKPPYGYRYAFNPYLEADFGTATFTTPAWNPQGQAGSVPNLGRTTDCISCHEVATYTVSAAPSPIPGYVAHGDQPQLVTPNSILVRNLWSMADRAPHPKTP